MPGWGRVNYEAYAEDAGGKSVHDETLPSWEDASPDVRRHWEYSADAVIDSYLGQRDAPKEQGDPHG